MLLQALYAYADRKKLLAGLPFQVRTVHWLIPLKANGEVRGGGFVPLSTPVTKGKKTREEPGREYVLPRFPGENNGGKAYYLAENFATVFGVRRDAGETLPVEPRAREDRNPVFAFRHFWERIAEAHARTSDARLGTLLAFRDHYLPERDGAVALFEWLAWRPNDSSRKKESEWHGRTATGDWAPLNKVNTVAFEVDGAALVTPADDPLWKDWAAVYRREAFADAEDDPEGSEGTASVCLVTGATDLPIARSHKPKILGVPGLASGGYVVSFAKEAPAFSSYGFEMGENAPVSEEAAAAYALALNDLLASDDTSFKVGNVAFCFWAGEQTKQSVLKFKALSRANPRNVATFLKGPFAGIDRKLAHQEDFFTVALSANAGRVVVRQWIRVTLAQALLNLKSWFEDLEIVSLAEGTAQEEGAEEKGGPYSLFRLAAALVRDSKELKRVSEAVTELYHAAIDYRKEPPPDVLESGGPYRPADQAQRPMQPALLRLMEPLLTEFHSALVTDSKKKPRYPFNQSRFALLKLILVRNAKGGFMAKAHLIGTDDKAYNLGRLLCILASLQKAARKRGKAGPAAKEGAEGPGVVERYYGSASSAPASAFSVLWKLHQHHLRKLEQEGEPGVRVASAFRAKIARVIAFFPPGESDGPPTFPAQLSTEEQGRFALGFYQQMAYDLAAASVRGLLKQARKVTGQPDEARALIAQARKKAESLGYEDLAAMASAAEKRIQ